MPYSALAVANRFLYLAKRDEVSVSPMKIIKLAYIAHGWYLAMMDGKPLLNEMVEAWKYGPVVPSLYHEFKEFGNQPIQRLAIRAKLRGPGPPKIIRPRVPKEATGARGVIRAVWEEYGELSAIRLSTLTHQVGTPWHTVWTKRGGQIAFGLDIPNRLIARHYRDLANAAAAA